MHDDGVPVDGLRALCGIGGYWFGFFAFARPGAGGAG